MLAGAAPQVDQQYSVVSVNERSVLLVLVVGIVMLEDVEHIAMPLEEQVRGLQHAFLLT